MAAGEIVRRHGGALPSTLAELVALPGVGQYTARAVLAFAFEADVGVVEVNSARVLARAVAGRSLGAGEAQALADGLVPERGGWAWNQAMLDLGATVCTKTAPRCGDCPLRTCCAWAAAGRRRCAGRARSWCDVTLTLRGGSPGFALAVGRDGPPGPAVAADA